MSRLKNWLSLAAACAVLAFPATAAMANEYPNRPIRLICPYAAGGLTDVLSRMLAKRLSERLGQQVVVDNRTGAGGIIGTEAAAKAPADGYTLVLVSQGLASVNSSLYKTLPYDTFRDFQPVSLVSTFSMVLVSNPNQPPKSLSEFISMAKAKPGALNYGSAGNATTSHLITELFKDEVGVDITHIPFKGESQAFTELMAGRLTAMFSTVGGTLPLIQSGRLRALAVATKERSKLLPNVPTVSEAGVPNFEVVGWYGVLIQAAVPQAIVSRLNKEIDGITREPEFREQMFARGMEVRGSSQEEFAKLIKSETERWKKLVVKANIRPD